MGRQPLGDGWVKLGAELRRVRKDAKLSTSRIRKFNKRNEFFSDTQISLVERGLARASEELIESYVAIGGDRQSLCLLLGKARDVREPLQPIESGVPRLITPDSPYQEIRKSYLIDEVEGMHVFGSKGVLEEVTNIVSIKALYPDTRYYSGIYSYHADARPGVISIESDYNCSLAAVRESASGVVEFVLELGQPIGQIDVEGCAFSYKATIRSDVATRPILRTRSRSGLRRYSIRTKFSHPAVPDRIWWFRCSDSIDAELDPHPGQLLRHNGGGFYFHDFVNLRDEFSGLAWTGDSWP